MDYSTLKNIKTPQEINNIDAIDLSDNYVNDNNEEILENQTTINNNNNNNNFCKSDGNDNHLNDLTQETKLKLNFSVDRILGNDYTNNSGNSDDINFNKKFCDYIQTTTTTTKSSCSDCSVMDGCSSAGIRSTIISTNQHTTPTNDNDQHQQIFSVPFTTMATMINLSKSVVRPMPVRYLTRAPSVSMVSAISSTPSSIAQQYLKFHQLHQQQQHHHHHQHPHHQQLSNSSYKSHSTISGSNGSNNHRQTITMIDAPTQSTNSNNLSNSKRKRSWSRAVFSQLQRKGLEIQFQIQKYITKPDRRKLAARLGLTDAQVKVWFQNRRMKWRHTRETKMNQEKTNGNIGGLIMANDLDRLDDMQETSSSSDEDEIDVVAE